MAASRAPEPTWTEMVLGHLAVGSDGPAAVTATPAGAHTTTRGELLATTAGALDLLDAAGVEAGEDVPALVSSRPESIALLLAGSASRRPLAPLAPRMTVRELTACIANLTGRVLVTEPAWADLAQQLATATDRTVLVVDAIAPSSREVVATGDDGSTALTMHTSGTTGLPKAVRVGERPLADRAALIARLLQVDRDTRLVTAALFHHVGAVGNITATMANGGAIVAFPAFSVDAWRSLDAVGPTHCVLIPSVIEMLLAADALVLPSLRVILYGASPIHPDTLARVLGLLPTVDFVNLFGQTEGSPLTVLDPDDHRAAAAGRTDLLASVGRAVPGAEVTLHAVDDDGVGEVWARSKQSFVTDDEGWQHTGDLARMVDGYVYLVGRKNDRIIRGGENVFPVEVEQVLVSHPAVGDAAVVGVPDRRLGESVAAFLVPSRPGVAIDPDELRTYARQSLAGFKVPAAWHVVDELPRNPSGKVMRTVLRQRATDLDPSRPEMV